MEKVLLPALALSIAAPLLVGAQPRGTDNRMIQYALRSQMEWHAQQLPKNSVLYQQQYAKLYTSNNRKLPKANAVYSFSNYKSGASSMISYSKKAILEQFPTSAQAGIYPSLRYLPANAGRKNSSNQSGKWDKQFLSKQ